MKDKIFLYSDPLLSNFIISLFSDFQIENLTNELKSIIDISEIKKWIKDDRLRPQSAETLYAIFVLNLWIRRNTL